MLKNKIQLTFLAVGVLLLFIVAGYTGFAIRFLAKNFNQALNGSAVGIQPEIHFRIEEADILRKK